MTVHRCRYCSRRLRVLPPLRLGRPPALCCCNQRCLSHDADLSSTLDPVQGQAVPLVKDDGERPGRGERL